MKRFLFFALLFVAFGFTDPTVADYSKIYKGDVLVAEGWTNFAGKKEAYWKFYYFNGNLKSEGHYHNGIAEKYWKFYYPNGKMSKEGHVIDGKKTAWWVFYNSLGEKVEECEFVDGKKHGFRLFYRNNDQLYKAQKYNQGVEVGEWTDYASFVRDNG